MVVVSAAFAIPVVHLTFDRNWTGLINFQLVSSLEYWFTKNVYVGDTSENNFAYDFYARIQMASSVE